MRKLIVWMLCVLMAVFVFSGCEGLKNGQDTTGPNITIAPQETENRDVLAAPPILTLSTDSGTVTVHYSTASWFCDDASDDDKAAAFIACGAHPLDNPEPKPIVLAGEYLELNFSHEPDSITVTRWDDDYIGDSSYDYAGDILLVEDGRIDFGCSGYIYQVSATWEDCGRGYYGDADYVFYAISAKARTPAAVPQTVEDPVTAYCGNIVTTVYLDGEQYSFMYEDSVAIADILINLDYDPDMLCNCLHEFEISIDGSEHYKINLTEFYVRYTEGQAKLTQTQADTIREIIEKLN